MFFHLSPSTSRLWKEELKVPKIGREELWSERCQRTELPQDSHQGWAGPTCTEHLPEPRESSGHTSRLRRECVLPQWPSEGRKSCWEQLTAGSVFPLARRDPWKRVGPQQKGPGPEEVPEGWAEDSTRQRDGGKFPHGEDTPNSPDVSHITYTSAQPVGISTHHKLSESDRIFLSWPLLPASALHVHGHMCVCKSVCVHVCPCAQGTGDSKRDAEPVVPGTRHGRGMLKGHVKAFV